MEAEQQEADQGNVIEIHLPDEFLEAAGGTWKLNEDGTAEEIHVVLMTEDSESAAFISESQNTRELLASLEGNDAKDVTIQHESQNVGQLDTRSVFLLSNQEKEFISIQDIESENAIALAEATTNSSQELHYKISSETFTSEPAAVINKLPQTDENPQLRMISDAQNNVDVHNIEAKLVNSIQEADSESLMAETADSSDNVKIAGMSNSSPDSLKAEITSTVDEIIEKSCATNEYQKDELRSVHPESSNMEESSGYSNMVDGEAHLTLSQDKADAGQGAATSDSDPIQKKGTEALQNNFLNRGKKRPLPVDEISEGGPPKKITVTDNTPEMSEEKKEGLKDKAREDDAVVDDAFKDNKEELSEMEACSSTTDHQTNSENEGDELVQFINVGDEWLQFSVDEGLLGNPPSALELKDLRVNMKPMPKAVVHSARRGHLRIAPLTLGRYMLFGIGDSSSEDEDDSDDEYENNNDNDIEVIQLDGDSDNNDDSSLLNAESIISAEESLEESARKDDNAMQTTSQTWSSVHAQFVEAMMTSSPKEARNKESEAAPIEIAECSSTGQILPTSVPDNKLVSEHDSEVTRIYSIHASNASNAAATLPSVTAVTQITGGTTDQPQQKVFSTVVKKSGFEDAILVASTPISAAVSTINNDSEDNNTSSRVLSFLSDDEKGDKKLGRKHAEDLPVKCPTCVKTYVATEEELTLHMRFHEEGCKTLKCPICGRVEIAWYHMARHARRHPEMQADILKLNIGERYKKSCPECNRKYATQAGLARHFEMYHGSHLELYHCPDCHRYFKDVATLSRHMEAHKNKDYWCKDCNFTTKVKKDFLIHRRGHGAEVFFCSECQHPFTKQSALKHHLAIKHKIREPVFCLECGCCYSSNAGLQIHIQRMHRQDQRHPCPHCDYVGTMRSNLYQHIDRTHIKPFKCEQCGYATKAESTLQRHIAAFHDQSRNHTCPHCHYRAATARHLTEHLRLQHNPNVLRYPCDYCNMKFKTLTMLRDHLPSHTGEMLYTCKICNFRCKYRPNMHRHMKKSHPGESLKENIQGPRQDLKFATRKRNQAQESAGNAPDVIISSMEPGTVEANPEVTIMTDDTFYTVEETASAVNALDGVQLSALATQQQLALNGEEMIEITEATAENLISSLLTVDPETGAILLNGKAVTVDGNVAFQIVQEEEADPSSAGEQSHKAVELLLLAMDPSVSNSQGEAVELPVINVASAESGFVGVAEEAAGSGENVDASSLVPAAAEVPMISAEEQ